MRKVTGLMIASLAVWAFCGLVPASAQTPPTAPAAVKPAEPPAVPPQAPPMRRAEIRREITGALGWKVGIPANAFSQLTFLEAAEKAKALGIETIVCNPDPASLTSVDTLASAANVNIAIENGSGRTTPAYGDPKELMKTITPLGKRIGVSANIGQWMQEGIKPIDGLS